MNEQQEREPVRHLIGLLDSLLYINDYGGLECSKKETSEIMQAIEDARAALAERTRQEALADDPLQGAANWIVAGLRGALVGDIQSRLLIGYNRAKRLYDAAPGAARPTSAANSTAPMQPSDEELRAAFTKDTGGPNPFYRCNVCGQLEPGVQEYLAAHWLKHKAAAPTQAAGGEALQRMLPMFERMLKDVVFTADTAGKVAADMDTLRNLAAAPASQAAGGEAVAFIKGWDQACMYLGQHGSLESDAAMRERMPKHYGAAPAAALDPDDFECCGNPVVGAQYMGQSEMVCCGNPEPKGAPAAAVEPTPIAQVSEVDGKKCVTFYSHKALYEAPLWTKLYARAAAAPEGLTDATEYARNLAVALHRDCYPEVTQWKPLDDLLGLLTQIDNMVSGMKRAAPTQAAGGDVLCHHEAYQGECIHCGVKIVNGRAAPAAAVEPTPATPDAKTAEERRPLTKERCISLLKYGPASVDMVRLIEREHGIGDQP